MRTAITRAFLRADPQASSRVSSAPQARSPMTRRMRLRRGFSIAEMLVVLIISGLIMNMALPRFAAMRDRMAIRSAKQQLGAYLVTARATAIRRSRTTLFRISNSTVWVTTKKADGTDSTIALNVPLATAQGVTVTKGGSSAADSVKYDLRGMAVLSSARTYVLTRNSSKDSICISRLGLIARRCGQ